MAMWWNTAAVLLIIQCTVATTLAVSPVHSALTYTIIPNDTSTHIVRSYGNETLITLQELADSFLDDSSHFYQNNITLSFAPGRHYLVGGVELNGMASVVIRGIVTNESKPEISCEDNGCFSFTKTSSILVENLVFTECYSVSEDSDGGALFISEAETVSITQCWFFDNLVRGRGGGAMRLQLIKNVNILQNQFINNSALSQISSSGAISATNIGLFVITESFFENNTASCCSGAVDVSHSSTRVVNSSFIRNGLISMTTSASSGGALLTDIGSVEILDSIFEKNYAIFDSSTQFLSSGGAACIIDTTTFINNTDFISNMGLAGGALVIRFNNKYHANILHSTFQNNIMTHSLPRSLGAGAMFIFLATNSGEKMSLTGQESVVSISSCMFVSNYAALSSSGSGVIFIFAGVLHITDCVFEKNIGIFGGVVSSHYTLIYSKDNRFISNTGYCFGALLANFGTLYSERDKYFGNEVFGYGGAIAAEQSYVSTLYCKFLNNTANLGGGAVYAIDGTFHSVKSFYKYNSAHQGGGALRLGNIIINTSGDYFCNNVGNGEIIDNNFLLNALSNFNENDQVNTIQLINVRGNCNNLTFINNTGSTYLILSTITFSGTTIFTNNTSTAGGALTLIRSTVVFEESSEIHVAGNNASHGGGVFLSESDLKVHASLLIIENNRATEFGGGIYAYQSSYIIDTPDLVLHTGNSATQGGAMFLIASRFEILKKSALFTNNEAFRGGAVALFEGAKIYILKTVDERMPFYHKSTFINVTFSNNRAEYGGALYVDDSTNSGILCDQSTHNFIPSITTKECFIQTINLFSLFLERRAVRNNTNYINVFFRSNIANKLGNDIFGGLLDRCQISAFAELHNLDIPKQTTGLTYLKAIAQFQVEIMYNPYYLPLKNSRAVTKEHLKGLIASNPVQLCFCTNNTYHDCAYQWPEILVQRGHPFSIRVVTVDQVENLANGTVLTNIISSGASTRLMAGQSQQLTAGTCTDLTYNIFSTELNVTLELYPDGPCGSTGISSRKVNIIFTECDCPSGLQPAPLNNECQCECEDSLNTYISSCQLNNDVDINQNVTVTVVRATKDYWIQYYDLHNDSSGFLLQTCPYDYCVKSPVNLSISLPLNVDKQCAYNRAGIMCGECDEGLSFVFGSSRCLDCHNNYLALLIAFAFAGIALVAFILSLNMTVAIGTIHGLVLYANIVAANSPVFVPPETALGFFISWVNLDLGIETCFYDGMDAYAKVLLQLVFPAYIISLSILIIIVSNYWGWFAELIGQKNPVATLCTLFLLSYSKLLRTTIASLQYTQLDYPGDTSSILWLYNPNVSYYASKRVPFFILSIIIIACGSIFTILLFFGQWLKKNRKLARITWNSKYNAFIDACHAPFVFKHRYWIGVLLLVRIIHHFLSAILEESTFLLIVSCLMCALLILKLLVFEVYKNWLIGFLETSYLMNILMFSVSTYYVSITNGDQVALANISISITFITFSGIFLYHIHAYFLSSLKAYDKLITLVKQCLIISKWKTTKATSHDKDIDDTELQMDQLREPALDIIAPITTQDYRSRRHSSTAVPKISAVTSTMVCIKREY